ncbi:DUF3515 domain-containing protein [Cellulomonas sp. ATA003]|uniref:DUF3515 domain-containing protein n=1 Tax=Cellulomonas sp. ATA003 TaxID=3073064 RepID=UPI002872F395|nr:DUF3515 domain-containing protein [Cellulomonas sp. ATA003]WNB84658.1 DUF3515 domain-containing protein [Cellulomonas sp. ATA003]
MTAPHPTRRTGATRRSDRTRAAALGLAAAVTLGGCTSAVQVSAAPHADDPLCASVVLAVPDVLGDAERRQTTSQGTVAWTEGDGEPITLRCGVDPLPPTTDQCVTVDDGRGTSVDWVTIPGDEATGDPWTFTTYGRLPAIRVEVPLSVTAERSTSFLVDLGPAVSATEQSRSCL